MKWVRKNFMEVFEMKWRNGKMCFWIDQEWIKIIGWKLKKILQKNNDKNDLWKIVDIK